MFCLGFYYLFYIREQLDLSPAAECAQEQQCEL